jgi:hypothetical protein
MIVLSSRRRSSGVPKSKSEKPDECGQHMPVAAEFWRARRKVWLKNIFDA